MKLVRRLTGQKIYEVTGSDKAGVCPDTRQQPQAPTKLAFVLLFVGAVKTLRACMEDLLLWSILNLLIY